MQIYPNGLRYPSGEPLAAPLDELELATRLLAAQGHVEATHALEQPVRGARVPVRVDAMDPRAAGWTFLVASNDPQRDGIIDRLRTLADRRAMKDPRAPLVFSPDADWSDWIMTNYLNVPDADRPQYVLLVGDPERLPFRFQSMLDSVALVGRVSFETLDQLAAYVEKVDRLERSQTQPGRPDALFFGPDGGRQANGNMDATHFSAEYMIKPLATAAQEWFSVTSLVGSTATKSALNDGLAGIRAGLVYSASHGVGATDGPLDVQLRLNGAVCCQPTGQEHSFDERLFAAADVPSDRPVLEGGIWFQFACYGYGTPAKSEFAQWQLGLPPDNSSVDFVAALPQRLLAHPRGPVAFIGHVDTAWLQGFNDTQAPQALASSWSPRLAPFRSAVQSMGLGRPVAFALNDLHRRSATLDADLSDTGAKLLAGTYPDDPAHRQKLADKFVLRCDARNYLLFGDPAASMCLP